MFGLFGGPRGRGSQKGAATESYDYALALEDVRANLGPAPRTVDSLIKVIWR